MEDNSIYIIITTIFIPILTAILPKILEKIIKDKDDKSSKSNIYNNSGNENINVKINSDNTINQNININVSSKSSADSSSSDAFSAIFIALLALFLFIYYKPIIDVVFVVYILLFSILYSIFVIKKYPQLNLKGFRIYIFLVCVVFFVSLLTWNKYVKPLNINTTEEYLGILGSLTSQEGLKRFIVIFYSFFVIVFSICISLVNFKKHLTQKITEESIISFWNSLNKVYLTMIPVSYMLYYIVYLLNKIN